MGHSAVRQHGLETENFNSDRVAAFNIDPQQLAIDS